MCGQGRHRLLSHLFGVGRPNPQLPLNPFCRILNTFANPLHITSNRLFFHTLLFLFPSTYISFTNLIAILIYSLAFYLLLKSLVHYVLYTPLVRLILISVTLISWSISLSTAQHYDTYIIAGLIMVLYNLPFSLIDILSSYKTSDTSIHII